MNIIQSKNIILILISIACLINSNKLFSVENNHDSSFSFIFEISGGYSAGLDSNFLNGGFSPDFRLMWEPDHKLNIGLQTAKLLIESIHTPEKQYKAGKSEMNVTLNAIPILFVVNMEIWKLDLYGGMGVSYVWTDLEAFDDNVFSYEWNYSLMFSAGYTYMLNDWFGIGTETKTYIFTKLNKNIASLQLKLKFRLLEW